MTVTLLTDKDLHWEWGSKASYRIGTGWGTKIDVHPAPGYTHDMNIVKAELLINQQYLPVKSKLYVGSHEHVSGTNGFAQHHNYYDHDTPDEGKDYTYRKEYLIFLAGKPTAIHPATTPYMVAHEFGHNVEYWLSDKWGCGEGKISSLLDIYAKARGVEKPAYYGPGTWHLSPTEVFANDWRTVVMDLDLNFWPHEVSLIPGNEELDPLFEWWSRVVEDPVKERWEELNELAEATSNV